MSIENKELEDPGDLIDENENQIRQDNKDNDGKSLKLGQKIPYKDRKLEHKLKKYELIIKKFENVNRLIDSDSQVLTFIKHAFKTKLQINFF